MHIFDVHLKKIFPGAKPPDPRREGVPPSRTLSRVRQAISPPLNPSCPRPAKISADAHALLYSKISTIFCVHSQSSTIWTKDPIIGLYSVQAYYWGPWLIDFS